VTLIGCCPGQLPGCFDSGAVGDSILLGYAAVSLGECFQMFRRIVVPLSSTVEGLKKLS
jgi:hypothetical protein